MTGVPTLFDEALAARRAARSDPAVDFLDRRAAHEAADRLTLSGRSFEVIVVRARLPSAVIPILRAAYPASRIAIADDPIVPAPEQGDCLVSVFAAETVNDVPGYLVRCRSDLKPDGLFVAAMLAGETLGELRAAWMRAESDTAGGASPRVAPFPGIRELGSLLQRAGFAMPVADSEKLTVRYGDPEALMRDIKAMGWSNPLAARNRQTVSRRLLAAAAKRYREEFSDADGRIRATFDIGWLTGWSPGPGQPVPLKPGSAAVRLADALGTVERKPR
jgi:hypothetical protein